MRNLIMIMKTYQSLCQKPEPHKQYFKTLTLPKDVIAMLEEGSLSQVRKTIIGLGNASTIEKLFLKITVLEKLSI